ncbi:hypothetical protein PG995_003285 [Apiospora arundinis]
MFTPFPSLAPELRNHIWKQTLPEDIGPALYFYRKRGCWGPRRITEALHGYQHADEDHNLALDFRLDLLGHDQQFDLPIFFVSREARGIARTWLETHLTASCNSTSASCLKEAERSSFHEDSAPKLTRSYVPDGKWEDFCLEAMDRLSEPDLMGKSVDLHSALRSVAVSETLFQRADVISYLPEAQRWYEGLQVLYVVIGPQPDGEPGPWRWSLDGLDGGAILWDREQEQFELQGVSEGYDKNLCHTNMEVVALGLDPSWGFGQMRGPLNTVGFMPDDTPRPQLPPRPTKEELEQVSQEIGIMLKTAPV